MYKIIVKKKARKFIDKLPKTEKIRIVSEIQALGFYSKSPGSRKP